MSLHLPRPIKLALLAIRDAIASAGPILFLVVGVLVAAYIYVKPQPPKTVTLATGPEGSAYAEFGKRYANALKASGIQVVLKPTSGSVDNLRLLREGQADVAFVRGGTADPVKDEEAGLLSLGALFYEPLWIFYRPEALIPPEVKAAQKAAQEKAAHAKQRGHAAAAPPPPPPPVLSTLVQLRGLRVNVDEPGSGVPEIMDKLLRASRIEKGDIELSTLTPAQASQALEAGLLDAVVLASAPQSPVMQRLLRAPGHVHKLDQLLGGARVHAAAVLPRVHVGLQAHVREHAGLAARHRAAQVRHHALREVVGLHILREDHLHEGQLHAEVAADHAAHQARVREVAHALFGERAHAGDVEQREVVRSVACGEAPLDGLEHGLGHARAAVAAGQHHVAIAQQRGSGVRGDAVDHGRALLRRVLSRPGAR